MTRRSGWIDYSVSLVVGVVLTGLSYGVGKLAHWTTTSLTWLEVFAVFTSYACTYLCVVERRLNYPLGAISSIAYAVLFWRTHLYASAILNAYLIPTLVYGWYRWRRDIDTRPVGKLDKRWIPAYLGVTGVFYLIAVLVTNHYGGKLAWSDSFILAGSILAQFLLDNKKLINWGIWFAVDVVAIWEYATTGLKLVAFQYVFFLLNTIYGYVIWKRSMRCVTPSY